MRAILSRYAVLFFCVFLSGWALLYTSQSVQQAEDRKAVIAAKIRQEQTRIDILRAEWDYLNAPDRLERLAKQYLDLVPLDQPQTLKDAQDLPKIPEEQPSMGLQNAIYEPAGGRP